MDFSRFSDDNFDLKTWINAAFKTQKDTNQNQEQFVATQITKLQVFIQEINNLIDETSQQTIQNFPRILREIEILKQETYMLKDQMKNVKEDLLKVEKNTVNESMKLLLDLDIIRTNMINVQMTLQEADNWSTLSSELDSVLQTRDLIKISNHIESMQNSLALLQDSSDYTNRATLLEDFKNKFETFISPDIIAAFNSKSIEASRNFVEIFSKMNRSDDLKKYYYQCEKAKIIEKYQTVSSNLTERFKSSTSQSSSSSVVFSVGSADSSTNSLAEDLRQLLKSWLDYSLEVYHSETQWCRMIFTDPHAIVYNLMTKCFEEFNKNFLKFLDQFIAGDKRNQSSESLNCLSQLKLDVDLFVSTIYSSAENATLTKVVHLQDLLYKLMQEIYSPFKLYMKQYGQLVLKYLQSKFEATIKLNHNDTFECVELLNGSVMKVFNLVDHEIDRCHEFTHGCGFSMLIDALKIFLKNYIEDFKRIVLNLKERKKHEKQQQHHQRQPSGDSSIAAAAAAAVADDGEDWDTFRHFVRIIQIVGDLIVKYEGLEETLVKQIQVSFIHNKKTGSRVGSTSGSSQPAQSIPTPISMNDIKQQFQNLQLNNQHDQLGLGDVDLLSVENYKDYLLEETDKNKLNSLIIVIESGDDYSIMKDLLRPLYLLSENVHKYAFDVVFAPIKHLLDTITKGNIWQQQQPAATNSRSSGNSSNQKDAIPLFALAPQEYITKIGQYILTLPQNFEPFTMQDNQNLKVALMKGKLPYLEEKDLSDELTVCWLDSIANATVIALCDEILKIPGAITVTSQRQLIIDIEFISSVFEDVGLKDFYNLKHILDLLKVDRDAYEDLSKTKPVRVVSAIRKLRSLS